MKTSEMPGASPPALYQGPNRNWEGFNTPLDSLFVILRMSGAPVFIVSVTT